MRGALFGAPSCKMIDEFDFRPKINSDVLRRPGLRGRGNTL